MHNMVHIACVSDNHFCRHMGVMLCSLLENTAAPGCVIIHAVDAGIDCRNRKKLRHLVRRYGAELRFLKADAEMYAGLPLTLNMTAAVYHWLSVPELIKGETDRVIYLDSDLVVLKDIAILWKSRIHEDAIVAAVAEPFFNRYADLEIPASAACFNAGVVLVDVNKWLSENVTEKVIDFISAHADKIRFWDQDGLNAVLHDRWMPIAPKWNQHVNLLPEKAAERFAPNAFQEALRDPAVVHYTTRSKPWHCRNTHPFKKYYFDYLKKTPWKRYACKDHLVYRALRKYFPRLAKNFLDM